MKVKAHRYTSFLKYVLAFNGYNQQDMKLDTLCLCLDEIASSNAKEVEEYLISVCIDIISTL